MDDLEADTLLDLLTLSQLTTNLAKRGWRAIPHAYAEKAYPDQLKSGWWPTLPKED
jgi:hypothetical protein